ncbi:hypothetical protein Dsin_025910 [Dipteronia sinensis]|uniref:Uncharacterized protein n=1 Tax=Dipteronia sinensis TaxID=43782 RepID=A0AAD9ZWK9_9ROSI|nr:hypothetical protein Dsin_025910 [Dipteronia sinensis]
MPVMEKLRMFVAQEPVVAASCLITGVDKCIQNVMAVAEARAVWQRTANCCFVLEDKRAPKLACCQSSSSSSKQVEMQVLVLCSMKCRQDLFELLS